ncbi:MAG TPA: hypothetical protein VNV37_03975, partial [Solirubrobacteraceae bacterium]|nr:hypothetical protein [Solirubrobacteraceae bacterium]
AGVARMPLLRFSVLTVIGSIPWVLALALAGHALGGDWTSVRKGFEYVDYAIVALVVVGVVYWRVRRRAGRASEALAVADEPERVPAVPVPVGKSAPTDLG